MQAAYKIPSIVFGNQRSKKDYFEENGADKNGQTSECRAFLLEFPGVRAL